MDAFRSLFSRVVTGSACRDTPLMLLLQTPRVAPRSRHSQLLRSWEVRSWEAGGGH